MELNNAVALVTGANRGLGRHLAQQLIDRGAKVYAAARRPETVDVPGAVPLRLDVTDAESGGGGGRPRRPAHPPQATRRAPRP
ncbi:SDR family NAD(P)-dependent oxidoreductase, partial [Streptomyces sp. NPDC059544]|uniref:SDR family NAD(P)-dependent oxidoreductase n=1 Tax=Streptomyces sp. NPDC059544 TaxID=3346861 RepID=UPI003678FFE3